MIARPESSSQRIFPLIQANIYDLDPVAAGLSPDQQVTRNILSLANSKFTRWERLVGWKLDPQGQMAHLLLQHRLAIEAELAAQWQRADFYWRQVLIELKVFSKQETNWQALVTDLASPLEASLVRDPIQLRQRIVDELLIDTHCAFYNARLNQVKTLSLSDRAFVHVDYIQQLLNWSGVSGKAVRMLLEDPWQTRIDLYKEAKKWKSAIHVCTQRLKYLPTAIDYQTEPADLHVSATLAKLREAKSDAQHSQNAIALQKGIQSLEKRVKTYPDHASLFEALSRLHHLRAISLVNSGQFVEALVSVQKAVTYNPYLDQVWETRNELVKVMEQLQAQMNQVQAEMSQQPNANLNDKGKRLLAQANQGFEPMNKYIDSKSAKETIFAAQIARAIRLWRNIELPEPTKGWQMQALQGITPDLDNRETMIEGTQGWSKLALKLWYKVSDLWQKPPRSSLEIQAAWDAVIANDADLASLDSQSICKFLGSKLFEEESDRVLITPPVPATSPLQLTPISSSRKLGTEPLLPWLFSRQDGRIKLQATVASVLFLTAGGLTLREQQASAIRDASYQNILVANRYQDDLRVVQQSEAFFAHAPLSGKDGRKQQVMELYSKSLVRWVAQQDDQPDATTQKHLDRYRTVLNTVQPSENQP